MKITIAYIPEEERKARIIARFARRLVDNIEADCTVEPQLSARAHEDIPPVGVRPSSGLAPRSTAGLRTQETLEMENWR